MEGETWVPIKDYEDRYEISNYGRINCFTENKPIQSPQFNKNNNRGYISINLISSTGGRSVFLYHRLLAQAFIPNPDNKPFINHKDGDKSNNSLDNLEWSTHQENMQHAWDIGLQPKTRKSKKLIV